MKAGRLESPPAGPPPGTSLRASPPPGDPLQGLGLGSAACRSQGRARARRFLVGVGQTAGPFRLATFWETRVETMARCREGFVSPNFSVGKGCSAHARLRAAQRRGALPAPSSGRSCASFGVKHQFLGIYNPVDWGEASPQLVFDGEGEDC